MSASWARAVHEPTIACPGADPHTSTSRTGGAFPCPVREIACQLIFKSLPMAKLSGIYVLREGEQTLAGMTVEIVLIRDVESLTEILDEVLLVFDADRETYQLVGDADL